MMKEVKRFFGYLIHRIYKRGVKLMSFPTENWEWGGYFYMLGNLSAIPSTIIFVFFMNNIQGDIKLIFDKYLNSILVKIFVGVLFFIPVMYLFSLLIPHKYVKSLEYTPEERKKYRNIFLVLLVLFLSFLVYDMANFFQENPNLEPPREK